MYVSLVILNEFPAPNSHTRNFQSRNYANVAFVDHVEKEEKRSNRGNRAVQGKIVVKS